jgi:hypothetical protein
MICRPLHAALLAALLLARGIGTGAHSQEPSSHETTPPENERRSGQIVVLVEGAGGTDEFASLFDQWTAQWKAAATAGNADWIHIGGETPPKTTSDREQLQQTLVDLKNEDWELIWIVLIGHGTFDGQTARFNLQGPDLSAEELAQWLDGSPSPAVVINCTSASGPFLKALSSPERVVVTATRSGAEHNFARLGGYLATAIADPSADLDKDDQVSLLEAYLSACRRLQEFYQQDARLMSEHALLDDNGDGLGTRADWFRGIRASRSAQQGASLDGTRAHQIHLVASDREQRLGREQRQQRDLLEQSLEALRATRSAHDEAAYYRELEKIALSLAHLYRDAKDATVEPHESSPAPPGQD